jgi:DNA-binding transcriptional MerR regulator
MKFHRRRRRRPPRTRAKLVLPGFTAAELGAKVGMTARTVRYYTAQGILPAPQFRGSATRYVREHLIHLAAIRHLQRDRRYSLAAIRQHLAPLSAVELEGLAAVVLPEFAEPPAAAPPAVTPAQSASDAWHRLTLVPGLEIHLHAAASSEVRALAQGIVKGVQGG